MPEEQSFPQSKPSAWANEDKKREKRHTNNVCEKVDFIGAAPCVRARSSGLAEIEQCPRRWNVGSLKAEKSRADFPRFVMTVTTLRCATSQVVDFVKFYSQWPCPPVTSE